ncbi:MAG: phytoene/squalene synthase family protein [Verrucomicrobiota bacterium]|nr:phytoene/squalene synthase family protein [Verrucomicrobiota bacterium]
MSSRPQQELLPLLKAVSRSFYLTIRVMPSAVRGQIGLAYLLARATDTIADTELVPVEKRLQKLQELRAAILSGSGPAPDFFSLASCQSASAEKFLLQELPSVLQLLRSTQETERRLIQQVLDTITSGQELDLRRFGTPHPGVVHALKTTDELEDYTWRVAGCVGEFWTEICLLRLFPATADLRKQLLEDGKRFGQGLQLVNILRDIPRDLANGRCYIPEEALNRIGMAPAALLDPNNEPTFRAVYNPLLKKAENFLEAGWRYTNALPRNQVRVRLACAWPVLIGIQTVQKLKIGKILDPGIPIKIPRKNVRQIIFQTISAHYFPRRWNRLYEMVRDQA